MRLAVMTALAIVPDLAWACELPMAPAGWVDPPIQPASDCSFRDEIYLGGVTITGKPARNIGGGRIGQRIIVDGGCGKTEDVVFYDCNSGEGLWIAGRDYGDDLSGGRDADALFPPQGALVLSPTTSIADLAAIADREGYTHRRDLAVFLTEFFGKDIPDPACGCRVLYPDSPGAAQ